MQECLEMRNIGAGTAGLPPAAALIQGPLVQRQARQWLQPSLWLRVQPPVTVSLGACETRFCSSAPSPVPVICI